MCAQHPNAAAGSLNASQSRAEICFLGARCQEVLRRIRLCGRRVVGSGTTRREAVAVRSFHICQSSASGDCRVALTKVQQHSSIAWCHLLLEVEVDQLEELPRPGVLISRRRCWNACAVRRRWCRPHHFLLLAQFRKPNNRLTLIYFQRSSGSGASNTRRLVVKDGRPS